MTTIWPLPNIDIRDLISVEEQMRGWLNLIARAKTAQQEVSAYLRLHAMLAFFEIGRASCRERV